MSPLNSLVFGLGLFFLGLRLTGENMRQLSGPGLHELLKKSARHPLLAALIGICSGALMQSATAVTFIMVSMNAGGLIAARAAAPIIVWCNVGLTVLAFIASFNIHPIVAYVVGGAGIVLGTIRVRLWQAIAGALLGIGLILIALEIMSSGAAPLKDTEWFKAALNFAAISPFLSFVAGICVAALLQSNTGAVMLIITFATAHAISFETAVALIYGTNLGAILLRVFLASGLKGESLRLVRLEDMVCVWGGLLMMMLFFIERAGVPGVMHVANRLSGSPSIALAVVFFLSNLLPAFTFSFFLGPAWRMLGRFFPEEAKEEPGKLRYLGPQVLDDPSGALELIKMEQARLLKKVKFTPSRHPDDSKFNDLSHGVEDFFSRLAARGNLAVPEAARLHSARAVLSLIRHANESAEAFRHRASHCSEAFSHPLVESLRELQALAVEAVKDGESTDLQKLRDQAKLGNEFVQNAIGEARKAASTPPSLDEDGLIEDYSVAVWMLRRLAKTLQRPTG